MIRTPAQHYEEADRLLSEIEACDRPDLPFIRAKLNRAQVHAMLAQCGHLDDDMYDESWNVPEGGPYPRLETREATGERL